MKLTAYHLHHTKVRHEVAILLSFQLEEIHGNDGKHDLKDTCPRGEKGAREI